MITGLAGNLDEFQCMQNLKARYVFCFLVHRGDHNWRKFDISYFLYLIALAITHMGH